MPACTPLPKARIRAIPAASTRNFRDSPVGKTRKATSAYWFPGFIRAANCSAWAARRFWPWGAGPVGFQQDRQRSAINAIGQLDLTEKLTLTGTWLDMQMRADNTNYALWLTKGDADTQARGGASVAGALNVAFYQARPREATMAAAVYDLKAEYSGDRFLAELQFGNTDSSGGTRLREW